jgi:transcriptional regulator with XRE-family HTH domain
MNPDEDRTCFCIPCLAEHPEATFGQRFKAHRLAANLSRNELARKTGISWTILRKYENDRSYPGNARRRRIAKVLGVKVTALGLPLRLPRKGRPRKDQAGSENSPFPILTVKRILAWAEAHKLRHRKWPTIASGPVRYNPSVTWRLIDNALRHGIRGRPGGSSLRRLLAEHWRARNPKALPT